MNVSEPYHYIRRTASTAYDDFTFRRTESNPIGSASVIGLLQRRFYVLESISGAVTISVTDAVSNPTATIPRNYYTFLLENFNTIYTNVNTDGENIGLPFNPIQGTQPTFRIYLSPFWNVGFRTDTEPPGPQLIIPDVSNIVYDLTFKFRAVNPC